MQRNRNGLSGVGFEQNFRPVPFSRPKTRHLRVNEYTPSFRSRFIPGNHMLPADLSPAFAARSVISHCACWMSAKLIGSTALAASDPAQTLEGGLATPDAAIVYPIRNGVIGMLPDLAIRPMGQAGAVPADRVSMISYEVRVSTTTSAGKSATAFFRTPPSSKTFAPWPRPTSMIVICGLRGISMRPEPIFSMSRPGRSNMTSIWPTGGLSATGLRRYFVGGADRGAQEIGRQGALCPGPRPICRLIDDSFDGVVSLHTVYHVPEFEQEKAFNEVYRVLAPGGRAAVVYSWGRHSVLTLAFLLPVLGWRWLAVRVRRSLGLVAHDTNRSLYSHHHPHRWFASRRWPFAYEISSWRSVGVDFTKLYIHDRLLGRAILRWLFGLEDRWPRLFGIIGQYPTIVIAKPSRTGGCATPPRRGHG